MLKRNKIYLILGSIYLVFLLALPQISSEITPCLKQFREGPFEYNNCNFSLVVNRFIYIELAGLLVVITAAVIITKKFEVKKIIALGVLLATLLIVAFYIYLPIMQQKLEGKEIYLDTFQEEYGSI